jgi:2',3'-cyclic-nucleotide 2'-phosphodiesterase/3'-nucleotidase
MPAPFKPDRRTILAGSAALTLGGQLPAIAQGSAGGAGTIRLRLLETTDIHVHVAPYDYYRDAPDDTVGLAKLARLIDAARADAKNVLLFDNGDFNQGNPVGDFVALERGLKGDQIHPVIRAMNLIGYDAGTLGNHEFNYGLDFLDACLAGADFSFCSANVARGILGATARDDTPFINPYLILERDVTDEAGVEHVLKVGVIGFTPPQIMMWDEKHLRGKLETRDIVETAASFVPEMKEAGADIIVALAHTGIVGGTPQGRDENAALFLSRVPGIDVIFTGHQHQLFPGPNFAKVDGADLEKGTLNGVPAVMAGFWGSHLGQVDLVLQKEGGKFRILEHKVGNIPIFKREAGKVVPLVEAKVEITDAIREEHEGTLKYVRKPVGRTSERLETYFALIEDSPALQIVSDAQLWYAKRALAATPHAALPLLSAVAPFKAGGRGGPQAYTDVPAGEIAIRNVADIYVFPNTLKVVKITGAELKDWLERSAGIFNRIVPGGDEQLLINQAFPAYNFDVIDGVTYRIDVSQPSKFDGEGKLAEAGASRIVDLHHQGKPVQPGDVFAVVSNNYRASGGGSFAGAVAANIILDAPDYSRDIVSQYLAQAGTVSPRADGNWKLAPLPAATNIVFETSPVAKELSASRPHLAALPDGGNGFARYRLTLG